MSIQLQGLKPLLFRLSNVAAKQATEKCAFRPSGVKTPEENIHFMSCLKARPTKLRIFSQPVKPRPTKKFRKTASSVVAHKLTAIPGLWVRASALTKNAGNKMALAPEALSS
jgi:hypothetical protein